MGKRKGKFGRTGERWGKKGRADLEPQEAREGRRRQHSQKEATDERADRLMVPGWKGRRGLKWGTVEGLEVTSRSGSSQPSTGSSAQDAYSPKKHPPPLRRDGLQPARPRQRGKRSDQAHSGTDPFILQSSR